VIVITNGSVQADEQMYWFVAQTLAKAGYVVLTFDPQGQGQSDVQGEAPDQNEGTPSQSDGRPFFDGTEDAINFALSSPAHPYVPVASCSSGTSHAAKQDRRTKAGLDAPFNPFWALVDSNRLGIAGHSYGAAGVSYIAQWDPRVKAVVAWDNLSGTDPNAPFMGGGPVEQPCPANPAARTVAPITKPALGMSADYGLPATPNRSDPDPLAKTARSIAYSKAGVDTGELVIRGGSHLDFSWIPNAAFSGSLRGADMIDWYTTAWFDKYVKGDCTADRRLLTDRWRHDGEESAIDPGHDGNMFSFYYRSRLAIHLAGGQPYDNENIRDSAAGLSPGDGYAGNYSYVAIDRSPDTATTDFGSCPHPKQPPCVDRRRFRFRLHHSRHARVVKVEVFINGRRKLTRTGRNITSVTISRLPQRVFHVKIVSTQSTGSKLISTRTYRGCTKGAPTTRGVHHHR
jgi:dienelactone hydrolase